MRGEADDQFLLGTIKDGSLSRLGPIDATDGGRVAGRMAGFHSADGLSAWIVGSPVWRDQRLRALARDDGHAAALASAYRTYGEAFLSRLGGGFAVAIASRPEASGLLAIDRFGIETMAYATTASGSLAFGSSCAAVARIDGVGRDISPQGVFNYLFFYFIPAPGTVFRKVRKLLAGELLSWRGRDLRLRRYWDPPYEEHSSVSNRELGRRMMDLLDKSIERQTEGRDPARVGAFLSGGLDSSTVTGLLARRFGTTNAFTVRFDDRAHDESDYARTVARHFGVQHFEHRLTPREAIDAIAPVIACSPEPFGNTSVLPSLLCAKTARDNGVDLLLGGDGGDEIFGGNERYLDVLRTEAHPGIPRVLMSALPSPLGTALDRTVPSRLRGFWKRLTTRAPEQIFLYNLFVQRPPEDVLHRSFLERISIDEPLERARAAYDQTPNAQSLKRMMNMDRQITLADNDLRKIGIACAMAGIGVRYPFLDEDLVEFAARIPSDKLIQNGNLRDFYKDATRDFLPDEVIQKRKHGFGMPYVRWLKELREVKELVGDNVASFRSRDIINDNFANEVMAAVRSEIPTVLDGFAWDLMFLEQWLRRHAGPLQPGAGSVAT